MNSSGVALQLEPYASQLKTWPRDGRVILAQFDADSIVVYQAYRPAIGHFAAKHGYFGGEFALSRMSWIKPNFLWMMYRCGWSSKENQEVTLAIRIRRTAFDAILALAVHSAYVPGIYSNEDEWRRRVAGSDVRLQWDPDHDPQGRPVERRAIQLGLRGEVLRKYSREWILGVEDISDFVREQRARMDAGGDLQMPLEKPYPVSEAATLTHLGMG